jgi:hypothetical protein
MHPRNFSDKWSRFFLRLSEERYFYGKDLALPIKDSEFHDLNADQKASTHMLTLLYLPKVDKSDFQSMKSVRRIFDDSIPGFPVRVVLVVKI